MWARLDDQFTDHPKIIAVGPLASWLYVCGLVYSSRYLTDGFIPNGQVRKLADVDDPGSLAAKLVEMNLWEPTEGGYHIHDFLEYNPPSDKIRLERADNARRQAEWRDRHRDTRGQFHDSGSIGSNGLTDAVTTIGTDGDTNGKRVSAPSPSPSPSPSHDSSGNPLRVETDPGAVISAHDGLAWALTELESSTNPNAVIADLIAQLYGADRTPDFGRIGATKRKIGSYRDFAQLVVEVAPFNPHDVCAYVQAVHAKRQLKSGKPLQRRNKSRTVAPNQHAPPVESATPELDSPAEPITTAREDREFRFGAPTWPEALRNKLGREPTSRELKGLPP